MAFTNPKGTTQTSMSDINVTPFVDVMLVLLVIFMVTAPLLESGIQVDLPKTKTVKVISQERVVVTIDKQQTIYVGNDPVNIHRLGDVIHKHLKGAAKSPVYIRCDQAVSFGAFAQVLDALKQAKLNNLNIVTRPLDTKGTQLIRKRRGSPAKRLAHGRCHDDNSVDDRDSLRGPLVASIIFHVPPVVFAIVYTIWGSRLGKGWGQSLNTGSSIHVKAVASLPGVPSAHAQDYNSEQSGGEKSGPLPESARPQAAAAARDSKDSQV